MANTTGGEVGKEGGRREKGEGRRTFPSGVGRTSEDGVAVDEVVLRQLTVFLPKVSRRRRTEGWEERKSERAEEGDFGAILLAR